MYDHLNTKKYNSRCIIALFKTFMSKTFGTYVLQNIYRSNPWNSAALLEGCNPKESHILIAFLILSCSQKMEIWSKFLRCALLVNVEDGKKDSEKSLSNLLNIYFSDHSSIY